MFDLTAYVVYIISIVQVRRALGVGAELNKASGTVLISTSLGLLFLGEHRGKY